MENPNINKSSDIKNTPSDTSKREVKKSNKDAIINKKDVDESDISEEYFVNSNQESDGEDF